MFAIAKFLLKLLDQSVHTLAELTIFIQTVKPNVVLCNALTGLLYCLQVDFSADFIDDATVLWQWN